MITYNTFIQRFKDFADNHYFIRSFSHGAPEDVDLEKFNEYPLMHVIYTGANYEDTTKTLSFEVYIFDLPSHYENKQDRQKEVVSDAEQCAEDVIADIVNGGNIFVHEEDYTVQTARVTPLQEESSNVLAGVLLEVDIQIPYDRDACNAPIDGVSPEGGEIVYARRGVLRVRTVNSSTDVLSVRTIVVPNGSLTDDGGGQVTLNISGAAVASVTGTAPIVSSGGTTPAISITAASTSAAGSMSASDKTKLDGIAAGAEVNVNADWNAVSGDAQILNKPTLATVATTGSYTDLIDKPTIVSSVTGTAPIVSSGGTTPAISISAATTSAAGSMSSADKVKLDGIAAGAEVNVNADWNAVSGDAQILNKPAIVSAVTGTAPISVTGTTTRNVTISAATTGAAGSMSATDKTKLDGIAAGAEVNQNAFSNVAVSGQTTVAADSKTDTLTLVAGSNITLTTDASTDSITIAASGGGSASDSFANIAVSGQSTIVADSSTDTLTFAQSGGMEITTNATTDTITLRSKSLDEDDVTLLTARQIDLNAEYLELIDGVKIVANFSAASSAFGEEVRVVGGTTAGGQITFFEGASGANYVGFKAPDTLSANKVWTLPSADGTSGQVLSTNGTGTLSWATSSGGSSYSVVRTQSGTSYTLVLGDAGDYIQTTSTTAVTITVPTQVSVTWAADTEIYFEQNNTGQITFVGASGVTINTSETLKTAARYAVVALKRVAENVWTLTGERELI